MVEGKKLGETVLYCTMYGFIFGALFPLGAWLMDFTLISKRPITLGNLGIIHSSNCLHWVIDSAPAAAGFMGFMIGTGRRRLEVYAENLQQQVDERTQRLYETTQLAEAAKREAIYANEAKTKFVSSMSHELRSPLNAILGFSDI